MDQNPSSPIIIETQNQNNLGGISRFFPKLIFIILALVIIFEIYLGIKSLNAPKPKRLNNVAPVSDGIISLRTPKVTYNVGDKIPLSAMVFTSGHSISGVDLIIKYDSNLLTASGSGVTTSKTMFEEYPLKQVNASTGLIQISGIISSKSKGFDGGGIFATINLTAKKQGSTKFSIEFKPGQTNDSNIVDNLTGQDILGKVYDRTIVVK